jgi:hypothetical protein
MRFLSLIMGLTSLAALSPTQPAPHTFKTPEGAYAIVRFKTSHSGPTVPAAAVDLMVDGQTDQVILTPAVDRSPYEALLGPFRAGLHEARLGPSSLWPTVDVPLRIENTAIEIVTPADPRFALFSNAPAIGLRPDTIGTASDLPLLMYVEDTTEGDSRWLRYSIIFSHEDGGTPGPALMARWGRTTDIELAYEVELRDGRIVQARYQGPDHRVMQNERLGVRPPFLLVSTLNNMFLDRGRSAARVRMVPLKKDLTVRSRESVMDDHPWIYRVMAAELARERPAGVEDARDYLYVDLRLTSRSAGIAVGARTADGTTRWSDRGRADLVVSRQGEMRIAIPAAASHRPVALTVRCDPRPEPNGSSDPGHCDVDIRKAFRLGGEYLPEDPLFPAARLKIEAGTARDLPAAAGRIER